MKNEKKFISFLRMKTILESRTLTKAILRLPKEERRVFILVYLKNYSLKQLCNALRITKAEAITLKEKALDDFFWNIEKYE